MSRRHNDMCDLIAWILSHDGCFINTVHCAHVCNTQQTPTTNFTPYRVDVIDGTSVDDALQSSCRLRLCYYVVGSQLLPPFVRPGRTRASDRRRADALPAGHASAAPSAFSSGDDPASAHHSTTPNSSRYNLTFIGSCCSTK